MRVCTRDPDSRASCPCQYTKHLGSLRRLECTKKDEPLEIHGDTSALSSDTLREPIKEEVHVKDFIPEIKVICDKLDEAEGKLEREIWDETIVYILVAHSSGTTSTHHGDVNSISQQHCNAHDLKSPLINNYQQISVLHPMTNTPSAS